MGGLTPVFWTVAVPLKDSLCGVVNAVGELTEGVREKNAGCRGGKVVTPVDMIVVIAVVEGIGRVMSCVVGLRLNSGITSPPAIPKYRHCAGDGNAS